MTTSQFPAGAVEGVVSTVEGAGNASQQAATLRLCAMHHCVEFVRPGAMSHLWEVTLFGIHARGEDEAELCRNWLTVARNSLPALKMEAASPEEGRLRDLILRRAKALLVIARPDLYDRASILDACETITMSKSDPVDFSRADALMKQLTRETAGGASDD